MCVPVVMVFGDCRRAAVAVAVAVLVDFMRVFLNKASFLTCIGHCLDQALRAETSDRSCACDRGDARVEVHHHVRDARDRRESLLDSADAAATRHAADL
eukprot:COSAG02_NODE_5499_length_4278_cov_4.999282_7_plen_99_part_00